jgi:hypothetical protein
MASNTEMFKNYFADIKNLESIPEDLINCKCCDTHRKNFPTLGSELPKFNPNKDFSIKKPCLCPCRHVAREICREWDRINEVENLSTAEEDSEDSDASIGSLKDFIVEDSGFTKKERKKLDKALDMFRGKKSLRR